jgi:hypothetical protein
MQLKQRLKKIEDRLIINNTGSEYCDCDKTEKYRRATEAFFNSIGTDNEIDWIVDYDPNLETGRCDFCKKKLSLAQTKFLETAQKQYDAEHQSDNKNT